MSKISNYFIELLKDHQHQCFGGSVFGVKAVAVDKHGKLHTGNPRSHRNRYDKFIFGSNMIGEMRDTWSWWFSLSSSVDKSSVTYLVFPFKHPWSDQVQIFDLDLIDLGFDDNESSAIAHKFFEDVFLHMLDLLDAGNDIYKAGRMFLKRDTAYIHRMNIDLLVDE